VSARTDAHLVLSSGGVRCLAYIGALEQLERSTTFATVSTCSAGTLIGALLCSGISPQVMREEVMALDLHRLAGPLTFKGIRQITRRGSWPFALYRTPTIDEVFA
jgi:predicted acylesterase/phospholipase RssA